MGEGPRGSEVSRACRSGGHAACTCGIYLVHDMWPSWCTHCVAALCAICVLLAGIRRSKGHSAMPVKQRSS